MQMIKKRLFLMSFNFDFQVNSNARVLKKNYFELKELSYILKKAQLFFEEQDQVSKAACFQVTTYNFFSYWVQTYYIIASCKFSEWL